MTDDTTTKKQSPLDVLDQILTEAKQEGEVEAKAKEAAAAKEAQEALDRLKKEDEIRLAQAHQDLESTKHSPQYQAMLDQKQEAEEAVEEKAEQMTGLQIEQLHRLEP